MCTFYLAKHNIVSFINNYILHRFVGFQLLSDVAHVSTREVQSVEEHSTNVAFLSGKFASEIRFESMGYIAGLLHDVGKYNPIFQRYIQSATGLIMKTDAAYLDYNAYKGKIDHSTAGAVYALGLAKEDVFDKLAMEIIALAVMSHHTGLPDMVAPTPNGNTFDDRITKCDADQSYEYVKNSTSHYLENKITDEQLSSCGISMRKYIEKIESSKAGQFRLGLLSRNLLSCLIDADRIDTEQFMNGVYTHQSDEKINWSCLISKLTDYVAALESKGAMSEVRDAVLKACIVKSTGQKGTYTLSVPTGGGKTLSSLRFALEHIKHHNMSRIIYVVPYMSIIDQNAKVVRDALCDDNHDIVLEHHSSFFVEDSDMERYTDMTDNWDAPIIFTTMVQFLNTLFGSGTASVRRMHNMANSVIIFDEIQALPIRCTSLFNEAVNYLVEDCGCTAVLCTATQPGLDKLETHSIRLTYDHDIVPKSAFEFLPERVIIEDYTRDSGWSQEDVASLAISETEQNGSTLVIMNTKNDAQSVAKQIESLIGEVYYLSTNLCPKHRLEVIDEVRSSLVLKEKRTICVSTQVVEAGVDLDFDKVIRSLAGWNSIIQAAGRCNRNGKRAKPGKVMVINSSSESIGSIPEIRTGKDISKRILNHRLHTGDPDITMSKYTEWYHKEMKGINSMIFNYPLRDYDTSMYAMLSSNKKLNESRVKRYMKQSFRTANTEFEALEDDTTGVMVREMDSTGLIERIKSAMSESSHCPRGLMRAVQSISVNIRRGALKTMIGKGLVSEIVPDSGVYVYGGNYDCRYGLVQNGD